MTMKMTQQNKQLVIVATSICTIALSSLFFGVQIGMSYGDIGTGHIDIPTSFASVNKDRPHPISKTRIRGDTSSKKRPSAQRIEEDQTEPKRVGQTHDSSAKLAKTAKTAKTTLKGGPKPPKVRESKKIPFFFVQSVSKRAGSCLCLHRSHFFVGLRTALIRLEALVFSACSENTVNLS